MRRYKLIIAQTVFILAGLPMLACAENSASLVHQGNRLYKEKQYDAALKLYNEAQIKNPDSAQINYNIGIAQYRKGDYNLAIASLEKATISREKLLEAAANFNIANAKYKLGKLKENTDLEQTVNLLRQALDYYKRAIELDARDQDARINHELVEKELKTLLDKLKQQQEKQKEEQQQENKEAQAQQQGAQGQEQNKQKQNAEEKKAAESQEQKAAEAQKQEGVKEEKQGKEAAEEKKEGQGQESQAAQSQNEEAKEMTKQEASQLLEGYRQEEDASGKLEDRRRGSDSSVLKDW